MPDYPTIEEIRERLQGVNILKTARDTGILQQTLYGLKWGVQDDLIGRKYVTLAKYLFPEEESK